MLCPLGPGGLGSRPQTQFWPTAAGLGWTVGNTECSGQPPCQSGQGPNRISSETGDYRGMACLRGAAAGRGTAAVAPVSPEEVDAALGGMGCGGAPGCGGVRPGFLRGLGAGGGWLSVFLTRIVSEGCLPGGWRFAKTVSVPGPGRDPRVASGYRPISLLSMCYRLLERVVLRRMSPAVDGVLDVEQAGFRPGRSTQGQVLALTTYVENGYQ